VWLKIIHLASFESKCPNTAIKKTFTEKLEIGENNLKQGFSRKAMEFCSLLY